MSAQSPLSTHRQVIAGASPLPSGTRARWGEADALAGDRGSCGDRRPGRGGDQLMGWHEV